ncbi:MAG: M28 family peptidase [Chloroflexota bacterium]
MKINNNKHLLTWRVLAAMCCLFAWAFSTGGGVPALADDPATALVGIELPDEAALGDLASLGLNYYTRLYTQDGGLLLVAEADPAQQETLIKQGYAVHVLDANSDQAEYYLLYARPGVLDQTAAQADILYVSGRQAILRATPQQAGRLAASRMRLLPLHLRALGAPVVQPQAVLAAPAAISPYPLIDTMIDQVNTATLYQYVGDLSGEWATTIEGSLFTLTTRWSYASTYVAKATTYAYEHFQALGLPVSYHNYSMWGTPLRNVIAEQTGVNHPENIVLITAHIDSTSYGTPSTIAPGADDNASGTAGVMMAADILSQYDFDCTLRYALFTGEEQGLYGSEAYAAYIKSQGAQVAGVLNLDMIAYNSTAHPAPVMEMHTRLNNSGDLAIANTFVDVISAYGLGLTPNIYQDGVTYSDHSSFWGEGYPAIIAIEDDGDFNPYYHSPNDKLSAIDMNYFTEFVKASLATFAHMGCLMEGTLSGVVRDASTNAPLAGTVVQATLGDHQSWQAVSGADGSYSMTLQPGTLQVYATAAQHIPALQTGITVQYAQTRQLDLFLQQGYVYVLPLVSNEAP